jgi:hypothetical protein
MKFISYIGMVNDVQRGLDERSEAPDRTLRPKTVTAMSDRVVTSRLSR